MSDYAPPYDTEYEKRGYLNQSFRLFHPKDTRQHEFSYHYHDFYKILLFLQGDVTYCIEGKSYVLAPYDMVLINAGEVHRPLVHSARTYERVILYVSPEFLNAHRQKDYDLGLCFSRVQKEQSNVLRMPSLKNSRLFATLKELEAALKDEDFAGDLYREVLFLEFLIQLNRAALGDSLHFMETSEANEKILAVLAYLNEHLTETFSMDSLAEQFFLSKYYLMHSFKQETGYTIGNYLAIKRLRLARELISQGMPATAACFECGFQNYSTFFRAYKKHFGKSPGQSKT